MYMYFLSFSHENKLFGIHLTSFLSVGALEFSELKTPLVYTFFPPNIDFSRNAKATPTKPTRICTAPFEQGKMTQIKHTHICRRKTWVIPAIEEQTHPKLYTLAGDDRCLTYSTRAVRIRVGFGDR